MATANRESDSAVDLGPWGSLGASPGESGSGGRAPRAIWLNGDVLACACPECGSPMAIRLWLMVADCWLCGTSIELTEEQEREAKKLLAEREQRRGESSPGLPIVALEAQPAAKAPLRPSDLTRQDAASTSPETTGRIAEDAPRPIRPPLPRLMKGGRSAGAGRTAPAGTARTAGAAVAPARRTAAENLVRKRIQAVGAVRLWVRDLFRDLPAWLTSLILHMVALILLGLLTVPVSTDDRPMILATTVGLEELPGGREDVAKDEEPLEFEDPGIDDPLEVEADEALSPGDVTDLDDPFRPDNPLGMDKLDLTQPPSIPADSGGIGTMFSGRDPNARTGLLEQEGGTIETEAAVARGLDWLARHQSSDGSWSLDHFQGAGQCNGRCGSPGHPCDTAGTALALLPFLGAGQTHLTGDYTAEVKKGLDWLVRNQQSDGGLWTGGIQLSHMYAHGQGAIALCEAYGMTQDKDLAEPAQRAIDYIVAAQSGGGGWRYFPGQEGDTSVVGWQIMALRSGQMAYLDVPPETFEAAGRYLDRAQQDTTGGQYGYQPGTGATAAMTAEALLCRQYSGWPRDHSGLQSGARWLLRENAPNLHYPNMYYWYYATQVMHHMGGELWEEWNLKMRDILVKMQETEGHQAGSWTPAFSTHDAIGGRVYMTALAVCTLEVYYRHMPLYQDHAVEVEK